MLNVARVLRIVLLIFILIESFCMTVCLSISQYPPNTLFTVSYFTWIIIVFMGYLQEIENDIKRFKTEEDEGAD